MWIPGRYRSALELYEKICTFFLGSSSIIFIKFSLGSVIPKRGSQNRLELWKKAVKLTHPRGQFQGGGGQQCLNYKEGFSDCEMTKLGAQRNKWIWVARRKWTLPQFPKRVSLSNPLLAGHYRISFQSFPLVLLCPCLRGVPCCWNPRGVLRGLWSPRRVSSLPSEVL